MPYGFYMGSCKCFKSSARNSGRRLNIYISYSKSQYHTVDTYPSAASFFLSPLCTELNGCTFYSSEHCPLFLSTSVTDTDDRQGLSEALKVFRPFFRMSLKSLPISDMPPALSGSLCCR